MISKKMIAAGLIAITSLTAVPASASGVTAGFSYGSPGWGGHGWNQHRSHRWEHHRLNRGQVRWILRHRGYRHIRFVSTRGPVYQVTAWRHGRAYFIALSARSGEVLTRYRI